MGVSAPLLEGATLRRADIAETVVALEVRVPGETLVVIVAVTRTTRGAGILTSDERRSLWGTRLPAGYAGTNARALVEGGRLVAIGSRGVIVEREGRTHVLAVVGPRIVLGDDVALAGDIADDDARAAFEAAGAELARSVADEAIVRRRDAVLRAVHRGMAKLDRRVQATATDLARIGEADDIAARAQWLIAEAVRAPRGARSLEVTDWSSGEAVKIVVPLDPAKPARAQVEAMFHRARRLKRGALIAGERHRDAEAMRARLDAIAKRIPDATTLVALEENMAEAHAAAPRDVPLDRAQAPGKKKNEPQQASSPYRVFLAGGSTRVLVGKGAAKNDTLTFQVARPHDLWLHAKGSAGAHVVVPMAKNKELSPTLLVDAAHLAAHFSDARGEAIVDVSYAPRKFVRKPKGGAPGLVTIDREKVIAVRIEPARLKALLEAEEA